MELVRQHVAHTSVPAESLAQRLGNLTCQTGVMHHSRRFPVEKRGRFLGSLKVCNFIIEVEPQSWFQDIHVVKIVFPLRGGIILQQGDEMTSVHTGQWCLYERWQTLRAASGEAAELLAVMAPRVTLNSRGFELAQHILRPYTVMGGVSQVLLQTLVSALENLDSIAESTAEDIGNVLIDLIQLALKERIPERRLVTSRQTMRQRIERYIRRNLRDPELSLDKIAAGLHCSKRYLHRVFSAECETLGTYIRNARLERVATDLVRPDLLNHAITEIAFDWGFNNSAHFSRVFKEKYGISPRAFRNAGTARSGAAHQCRTRAL